jgi:hypothetical protein
VLGWLMVPIAITAVISELGQSIFQPRYLLVSLPALALLLGWLLDGVWKSTHRVSAGSLLRLTGPAVALTLLAGLVALRALQLAPSYGKSSEPWRAATRYVVDRAKPGDCVAFYPLDVRMPFRYYLGAGTSTPLVPVLPTLPWSEVRPYIEQYQVPGTSRLASLVRGCSRVWVVSSHAGEAEGPSVSRANLTRYLGLLGQLGSRYPSVQSVRFGNAGLISVTLLRR